MFVANWLNYTFELENLSYDNFRNSYFCSSSIQFHIFRTCETHTQLGYLLFFFESANCQFDLCVGLVFGNTSNN